MTASARMFPMPGLPAAKVVHADGSTLTANADGSFTVPEQLVSAMTAGGYILIDAVPAPATAASAGIPGQWAYDTGYIYICIAANSWKRVAIAAGF